jgi:hypothetical protein
MLADADTRSMQLRGLSTVGSLLLAIATIGCGTKKSAPSESSGSGGSGSGAGSAGSSAAKAGNVTVMLDGKPLAVARALVKTLPDGRAQLYLGEAGTCEQLMTNLFDSKDPHVLVDLVHYLLADGKDSVGVGDVYTGPSSKADPQSKASIRGELTKGGKVEIELKYLKAPEAKLEVDGNVTAEVCGDQDAPPAASAGAAMMKIAGRDFVVRAALKRGDDYELVDQPRDCTSAHYIGIRLKRERGTWNLDGTRIPGPLQGPAPALTVKPGPTKESPGPGRVMMELGGSDKVAAYDVALSGVVETIDCNYTPPKK